MKSILFIALFSGVINFADFKKSVISQSVCNVKPKAINEKDPLKSFIQSLAKAPMIDIPHGNKNLLKIFSAEWNLAGNKNIPQNKVTRTLESNYNSLDSTFFADIENRNQLIIQANYAVAQKLFSSNFIRYDDSLKLNKKISIKATAFQFGNLFKTYSLIVRGNRRCNDCEYPIHQAENILINIDKQNIVIDKLIVSSVIGSDLGSTCKFFFIDKDKVIHIKDFANDELTAGFKKYKQYKVSPNGHFIENTKK